MLTDLKIFGKLHPLISTVTPKATPNSYDIIERPFNWLPVHVKYSAQVTSDHEKIEYIISGLPSLSPQLSYVLKSVETKKVAVIFTLTITGLPIAKNILMAKMISAQDQLMLVFNEALANPDQFGLA